jgi:hypothetical protein
MRCWRSDEAGLWQEWEPERFALIHNGHNENPRNGRSPDSVGWSSGPIGIGVR